MNTPRYNEFNKDTMAKIKRAKKWTFSLTLLVAIIGATLFGGFYGNRLFGAPVQNDLRSG